MEINTFCVFLRKHYVAFCSYRPESSQNYEWCITSVRKLLPDVLELSSRDSRSIKEAGSWRLKVIKQVWYKITVEDGSVTLLITSMGLVVFLQCGKGLLFTLRFMLTPTHPPCLLLLPFSCPELFVHMNIRWFRTSVCQISDGFVPVCVKYKMVSYQCVSNIRWFLNQRVSYHQDASQQ